MTYFQAYLFSILDGLTIMLEIFTVFSTIFGVILIGICLFSAFDGEGVFVEKVLERKKILISIYITLLFLFIAIPNQKQVAFIYIAPKIINNTDLQESIKKLPKLTNLGLEYLNDILEEKTE